MTLPHYPSINKSIEIEPVYNSLVEIDFDNKILYHQIKSINNDKMIFNINYNNNKIEPFETILDMIKSKYKTNVTIKRLDRLNNVILIIKIYGFYFKSMDNLFDFDFSSEELYELETTFSFDKINIIKNNSLHADRLHKINKLMNRENKDIITLTKEELNFN